MNYEMYLLNDYILLSLICISSLPGFSGCVPGVWLGFAFPTFLCRVWLPDAATGVTHLGSSIPEPIRTVNTIGWCQMVLAPSTVQGQPRSCLLGAEPL